MELFAQNNPVGKNSQQPLAERVRPKNLSEFVGQEHLIKEGSVLHNIIQSGHIPSMIFWGPPGVGKTTLANIIANTVKTPFQALSAISAGVKEVREVIQNAKSRGKIILFIDEIHRFNKSQQDALLGAVEKGLITLIGATTENPSFEVNSALLSRCQIYILKPVSDKHIINLIEDVCQKDEILKSKKITIKEYDAILQMSNGDVRKALNLFELVINNLGENPGVTNESVIQIAQQQIVRYDKDGDMHYDIISAFIKSVRGSDPNAAIYWLARMIEGGEDPKFIARRLLILASEDIGNANPTALVMANACFQAVNVVGYPECRIILSQMTAYLASSPKSNASYMAINEALQKVKDTGNLPVPLHLRNAPTTMMKNLDYGKNYRYSHDFENNFAPQEYLPDELKNTVFYNPGKNARENELRNYLKNLWKDKYGY